MSKKNKKRIIAALYILSIVVAVGTGGWAHMEGIFYGKQIEQPPCNAILFTGNCGAIVGCNQYPRQKYTTYGTNVMRNILNPQNIANTDICENTNSACDHTTNNFIYTSGDFCYSN